MTTTTTATQSLADLPVTTLLQQARCIMARYLVDRRPHEDPYAFELFRRAIVQQDQDAWSALYNLYQTLVRTWVHQHLPPAHAEAGEGLINEAFFRLFHAVDATRFGQFHSAPSLLAYLRTCARSVVADFLRSHQAHRVEEPMDDLDYEVVLADPAEEMMAQLHAQEVWEIIGAAVNERERLVLQVICVLGWPACTLPRLYPALFSTVEEVYSSKNCSDLLIACCFWLRKGMSPLLAGLPEELLPPYQPLLPLVAHWKLREHDRGFLSCAGVFTWRSDLRQNPENTIELEMCSSSYSTPSQRKWK